VEEKKTLKKSHKKIKLGPEPRCQYCGDILPPQPDQTGFIFKTTINFHVECAVISNVPIQTWYDDIKDDPQTQLRWHWKSYLLDFSPTDMVESFVGGDDDTDTIRDTGDTEGSERQLSSDGGTAPGTC
jgi:hypothetical protein